MVTSGEDSLNEHTEDEGLETDGAQEETLNLLRMRLGRPKKNLEPSDEQLMATGEMDSEEPEEVEDVEDVEEGEEEDLGEPTPTSLTIPGEEDLSIRKQIEQGLLAGESREDLVARGFNKRSVQTVASELKSKTGTRRSIGKAPVTTAKGLPIFAKGSPPEAIVESMEVPDVANGQGIPFEQGIKFGMSIIILGVRVAQELSGIGITQAKPIVDMAKSMREGEALAAKNAAGEAAMEAAGMVQSSLMPMLANLQSGKGGAVGGDPMKNMMARTMEPIMQKVMGGMLGRLLPGTAPAQITDGGGGADSIEGWSHRSE